MGNVITVEEAGQRLGVSPSRIRALIYAGRLPAEKFGTNYAIKESSLKLVEHRPTGRPPGRKRRKKAA